MGALMVWIFVRAARRTDAPWWKIWLLGRGIIPTADELREADTEHQGRAEHADRM